MAFMKPEIYKGGYLVIDGPMGTEYLPHEIADIDNKTLEAWNNQEGNEHNLPGCIRGYVENHSAYSIEREAGILSRLSASGYMDSTPWEPGDSNDLCKAWDICPECFEQCWESETSDRCPGCNVSYPQDYDGCRKAGCSNCNGE